MKDAVEKSHEGSERYRGNREGHRAAPGLIMTRNEKEEGIAANSRRMKGLKCDRSGKGA